MAKQQLHLIDLDGNRRLEVRREGTRTNGTLLYCHGTPGAAVAFPALLAAADAAGLEVISWSRPGYGRSTRQRNRTVRSVAADAQAVVDFFELDEFVVAGWSGGGPHALAIAALTGGCRGALVMAGVGPATVADLDFLDGMAEENIEEFSLAFEGGRDFEEALAEMAESMSTVTLDALVEELGGLAPPPDAAAIAGPMGPYLVESFHHAMANGHGGWVDDDLAFVTDWGFDLSGIAAPVHVVQGDLDTMVPAAHATWLLTHVPHATGGVEAGHGHISMWDLAPSWFTALAGHLAP